MFNIRQNQIITDFTGHEITTGTIVMDAQGKPVRCTRVDWERGPVWVGEGYPPNMQGDGGPWRVLHVPPHLDDDVMQFEALRITREIQHMGGVRL